MCFLHTRSAVKKYRHSFTLSNCLFGSVKLTMNADPDKYKYNGYGLGFHSRSKHLFTGGSIGRNVIILRADMGSYVHADKKGKDMLILCEGPTQGLIQTLTEEAKCPINFTRSGKRFVLSLHFNEASVFYLLMLQKYINSKKKTQKQKIMYYVYIHYVIFQKILLLIIRKKNRIKRNFVLLTLIQFIITML